MKILKNTILITKHCYLFDMQEKIHAAKMDYTSKVDAFNIFEIML